MCLSVVSYLDGAQVGRGQAEPDVGQRVPADNPGVSESLGGRQPLARVHMQQLSHQVLWKTQTQIVRGVRHSSRQSDAADTDTDSQVSDTADTDADTDTANSQIRPDRTAARHRHIRQSDEAGQDRSQTQTHQTVR